MKKKNISKKVLAVLLSVIMIATSIPFVIMGTAAGTYDPAPYFDDAAKLEGADAWLDDEGNVQVTFPSATAQPTYKGEALSIAFYILELVDMGVKNESHTETSLGIIKVTGNSGTFAAEDIGELDLENKRYSVTINAVDEENWFSLPIYVTVTDVPHAELDDSLFLGLSDSATAVREMATFDAETESDNTATTSGNALLYMGTAEETGTEDLSDNFGDTAALRFIMYDQPSGTQTFYTSYSRETWDFKGAEEVWYWLDFSRVDIQGLSFNLGSQCKTVLGWADGSNVDVDEDEVIQYSTKGTTASAYTGEAPYVYVQREDGGWNKVMMTDGTIDLANFKGYVRIPLAFFCSVEDRYITTTNSEFGTDNMSLVASTSNPFASSSNLRPQTQANVDAYVATQQAASPILVDPAGTAITEALMLQYRRFNCVEHIKLGISVGTMDGWDIGYMPAAAVGSDSDDALYTATSDSKRAVVDLSAGTVTRDEDTYRAIEDLKTMGFSFEGATETSLQNSFFVDNIFFYRTDGGAYSENTLNDVISTGSPITTYYSEENTVANIIFDEIDKYISSPDWADYREVEYIFDLIAKYVSGYSSLGKDTTFLNLTRSPETTGLAGMATTLGREETWERVWQAWDDCIAGGTITEEGVFLSNANKNDLVPLIINTMEKLPHPDNIISVSDALRAEIVNLWQAYALLNLGQIEMLGAAEEATLLKYFDLIEHLESTDGEEFVVGNILADNPYIVFTDFEENTTLGERSYQIEDDKNVYSTGYTSVDGTVVGTANFANDWRHLKSLTTYTAISTSGVVGLGKTHYITDRDELGYSTTDEDIDNEVFDDKVLYNAAWAYISGNGYMNSKAVTVYSDSSFVGTNDDRKWHSVTISRDSLSADTWDSFYTNNTGEDGLGYLASAYTGLDDQSVPLSLVFYVDFTELSDTTKEYYFTVNLFTRDSSGNNVKVGVNTGSLNADRKYWILDNKTGDWEIIYTTNQFGFNFSGNAEEAESQGVDANSLYGYKGYLMVPLYHIKDRDDEKTDENEAYLNNIFAIQFACGGADMDEKSFTLDNVGFTYDPRCYTTGVTNLTNAGYTTQSYAEIFEAKSSAASNFETAVDSIDPYDEIGITAAVQNATALYNELPDYQKTVVAEAKATLDVYAGYVADTGTIPQPEYIITEMDDLIAALPDATKTASVTGDCDLLHPGFTNSEVNYSTYGLTAETAATIIGYYENSYKYYTVSEKASIDSTSLLNAYNAAMRCLSTLESIKTEAGSYGSASAGNTGSGFLGELSTDLYTRKYDDDGNFLGNFVSIAGRADVNTFKEDKYDVLQYYTKTTMDDGTYNSNVQNISRGFTYFLNNTQSYEVDGEPIEGGIITFRDKMQDIYDMANDHITNKTLFTDEEFQSIKDIIEEYNALLPAYYNVEELYELEQAILDLFPTASTETLDVTEVMLTADKLTGDASAYKVTYSEILDYDGSGDYYFVRVTSTNGAMTNDYGDSVAYNIAINSETKTSDAIVEASPYTATVTNNAYTPASPMSYVITPSVSAAQTGLSGTVRDTLTVELVLMEDGTETVIETQSIEVSYSMSDAYTVTIPAGFPVEWEDSSAQDVSYSVTTEMVATSKLTVGVTNDGTNKLTNTVTSDELTYTAENFVETEFGNRVTDAEPDPAPTVSVSGWDDVPVGEYRTTLTYTVVYDDGSDDGTT